MKLLHHFYSTIGVRPFAFPNGATSGNRPTSSDENQQYGATKKSSRGLSPSRSF